MAILLHLHRSSCNFFNVKFLLRHVVVVVSLNPKITELSIFSFWKHIFGVIQSAQMNEAVGDHFVPLHRHHFHCAVALRSRSPMLSHVWFIHFCCKALDCCVGCCMHTVVGHCDDAEILKCQLVKKADPNKKKGEKPIHFLAQFELC